MRRALLLLTVAAVVTVGLAAAAAARTETRFTVVAVHQSQHRSGNTIVSRDSLWSPVTGGRVGRDVVRIRFHKKSRTARLHAIGFFRGQGTLKVQGTFAPGRFNNRRFIIIGGTGEFNGAAGKLKVHSLSHRKDLLHFAFVQ